MIIAHDPNRDRLEAAVQLLCGAGNSGAAGERAYEQDCVMMAWRSAAEVANSAGPVGSKWNDRLSAQASVKHRCMAPNDFAMAKIGRTDGVVKVQWHFETFATE